MDRNVRIAKKLVRIARSLVASEKVFSHADLWWRVDDIGGLIIDCKMWAGDVFHGEKMKVDYDMAEKELRGILASVSRAVKSATGRKAEVRRNNEGALGWFFYVQFEGLPADYEKCRKAVEDALGKNYEVEWKRKMMFLTSDLYSEIP